MTQQITIDDHVVMTDPVLVASALAQDEVIAYDSETTGLDPHRSNIAVMQFFGQQSGVLGVVQVRNGQIHPAIKLLMRTSKALWVGHNVGMFDMQFLATHGVDPWVMRWYDTLVGESTVVDAGRRDVSKSLQSSLRRHLGLDIDKKIEHSWNVTTLNEQQIAYAARDVLSIPALMHAQKAKAVETGQEEALRMEQEVMPVFARMKFNGMPLQPRILREYVLEQRNEMNRLKAELVKTLGDINFNSPMQLKKAIAEKTGVVMHSTAAEVLVETSQDPDSPAKDICTLLSEYRFCSQRVKMYSDEWIQEHITDGRVHPSFWQIGTDTGRVSCTNPNMQQVPRDARKVFGHLPGYTIVACDYSQIEVRVMAHVSQDQTLLAMLKEEDIHTSIAAQIFNKSPSEVTKAERTISKACSFTLLFGGGAQRLYDYARLNGSTATLEDMKRVVVKFFVAFTGVAAFKEKARTITNRPGVAVVSMPNGLRRILAGDNKTLTRILNTKVQGAAAVGIKQAMIECGKRGLDKYLVATVHDELVACVPDAEAEAYGEALRDAMIAGMTFWVPTIVAAEIKSGISWK